MTRTNCLMRFLGEWLYKAQTHLDKLLPIAVGIVQTLKSLDDLVGDPLAALIGGLAPAIQNRVKAILPRILVELRLVSDLSQVLDERQINAGLRQLVLDLKHNTIESDKAYTLIAALVLQQCYDGKLTLAEAIMSVETYYQEHKETPQDQPQ